MAPPLRAIIVGAGHRAIGYARYAKAHPEHLKIVAVADSRELRRKQMAAEYDLPPERCYESAKVVAAEAKFADVVINGTMDHQHVPTSLPLIERGYDMLLEKPFATSEAEMWQLARAAESSGARVMICHVLRYAPFYAAIRKRVSDGEIGRVVNIQTIEHVSYHHMAIGFINGKWRSKKLCHSSMLMSKCCHDLDIIAWMKSGIRPVSVAGFGSNMQFRPENAPSGAGTHCLVDCPVESDCTYSARKLYLNHPDRWSFYVWEPLEDIDEPTIEDKTRSLETDNLYGRCVYKSDMDVVDHQSVVIRFEDGSTATHNMVGGTARPSRSIHLIGSEGEIQGVMEDSKFTIRHADTRPGHEYSEELADLTVGGDMHGAFGGHGGGDAALMDDFIRFIRREPASLSTTSIDDSIHGHLIGFSADKAMEEHRVVDMGTSAS
jgi:predicted dehydrogenase